MHTFCRRALINNERPQLSTIISGKTYKLYSNNELIQNVHNPELINLFKQAIWENKNPIWKGSYKLELENGTIIKQSYYGSFFSIQNVRGIYSIPTHLQSKYKQITTEQLNTIVIPWRKSQSSI